MGVASSVVVPLWAMVVDGHGCTDQNCNTGWVLRRVTNWLKILNEQAETGAEMAREVPATLANPEISRDQVKKLFAALEQQAEFVERLRVVLEANDFAPDVLYAAEALEDQYAELAASAAEKLREMRPDAAS